MSMLEIKNVHKSFFTYTKPRLQAGIFHRPGARKVTSELQVLRGVDLTVEKGDVVAILGPSGSGKTTLLRCLNFLETADAGQLTFDGETFDLAQASRADIARLRKKTAFVFQSYNLFRNKTALQNVTEGLIIARKNAQRAGGCRWHEDAGKGGPCRPSRLLSAPAFRRPAAARGHCPGTGLRPGDHLF